MNNTLTNPIGVDVVIQQIQEYLYFELSRVWVGDMNFYGRVYRNNVNSFDIDVPKWWNKTTKDYDDVMYNDDVNATVCFIDNERHDSQDGQVFTTDLKCVFMVNLNGIIPSYEDRADAKAQMDVLNLLEDITYLGFTVKSVEKGLNNVFRGFDTSKILKTDKQPKHCFSINMKLNYQIKC